MSLKTKKIFTATFLLVVLATGTSMILGLMHPVVSFEHSIEIGQPASITFEAYAVPKKMVTWYPALQHIDRVSGMGNNVGSIYKMLVEDGFGLITVTRTVLKYNKGELLSYIQESDQRREEVDVYFYPYGDTTMVMSYHKIAPKGVYNKAKAFLLQSKLIGDEHEVFNILKNNLEQH